MAIQLGTTRPISSYVDDRARKMIKAGVEIDENLCGIWGRSIIYKYQVGSASRPGQSHTVRYVSAEGPQDRDIVECTCEAGRRNLACSHVAVILDYIGVRRLPRQGGRDA